MGLQRLDHTSCIRKARRTPEIASPRLRAMARNDLWGLRWPAGTPATHETSYFHVNDGGGRLAVNDAPSQAVAPTTHKPRLRTGRPGAIAAPRPPANPDAGHAFVGVVMAAKVDLDPSLESWGMRCRRWRDRSEGGDLDPGLNAGACVLSMRSEEVLRARYRPRLL
jgi:hypothetical protein